MKNRKPIIGITMGDPLGIGPEISLKAILDPTIGKNTRCVVFGSLLIMQAAVQSLSLEKNVVACNIEDLADLWDKDEDSIYVVDVYPFDLEAHRIGTIDAEAGKAAFTYIQKAIEANLSGSIDAVVTGPIHKEALFKAGYTYAGHTEIFKDLTKANDVCMMLAHDGLHVSHVTTHVALKDVPSLIKKERTSRVIQLTHDALRVMGYDKPRIAVAGLNPHCGESGLFGSEDQEEILPAVHRAVQDGLDVKGPIPGDTVFVRAKGGEFDAVVAMYHDQGHIPLKLLGFKVDAKTGKWEAVSGVNVTLGLPIIRTSVDHGVAFDIAWKNKANEISMIDAIKYAYKLCGVS